MIFLGAYSTLKIKKYFKEGSYIVREIKMFIMRSPFDEIIDMVVDTIKREVFDLDEEWKKVTPYYGNHIRVQRYGGVYSHHGIYISDDEVIHFSGDEDDSILDNDACKIISTTLSQFLQGGTLEVRQYSEEEKRVLNSVESIVENARAAIGDREYSLLFGNCEHFAYECTLGEGKSIQVRKALLGEHPLGKMGKPLK